MLDEYDDPNEKAKQFLRQHGKSLFAVIVIIFLGLMAWSFYQHHRQKLTQENAGLYTLLLQEKSPQRAVLLLDEMTKLDPSGLYTVFAHFYLARLYFDQHDLKKTVSPLIWLTEHAIQPWSSLARLRAAIVMVDQGHNDQALHLLSDQSIAPGFQAVVLEKKGDIFMLKHDYMSSRQSYEKALTVLDDQTMPDHSMDTIQMTMRAAIKAKLMALGVSS